MTIDMTERICEDCVFVAANGESETAPEGFTPTGLWAVNWEEWEHDSSSFYVPFRPCPSCGTMLAGSWGHAERIN